MKTEDFLLVIMNSSQRDMLNGSGNDTICLDFTHGMSAHEFDLATIFVLDDKRERFPAAFILCNRQDSKALCESKAFYSFCGCKRTCKHFANNFDDRRCRIFLICMEDNFWISRKKTVVHVICGQKLEAKYININ
ncbi:hypothetical protein NPIL_353181 [Nephila pilipes]|uniref:Uncharacterized protein n=1 Tax=Nephila pilipes TaxID=299642 RepID=A0A8X6ULN9_NEPPI|nr:hypothetical protein NPIL_353181 [Nephila pilipes]